MSSSGRYDGKPLLRLLELFVLWAIDELPDADRLVLEGIAPKLHELYGGGGSWHEAIARAVQLPADAPAMIRDLWAKNRAIARSHGITLQPQEFAEMFVDQNFPM